MEEFRRSSVPVKDARKDWNRVDPDELTPRQKAWWNLRKNQGGSTIDRMIGQRIMFENAIKEMARIKADKDKEEALKRSSVEVLSSEGVTVEAVEEKPLESQGISKEKSKERMV